MKKLLSGSLLVILTLSLNAQDKYFTKTGNISFNSKTALENIEARHKSVTCVVDTKAGNIAFAILMKGFEFEKALMQEHFNENYVESNKFPKAEFKGEILNNAEINYSKNGNYSVKVKGKLAMHGETNDTEAMGTMIVKDGKIQVNSIFNILLSDYKIEIPKVVSDKVSNTVNIDVRCSLEPLKI